MELKPTNTPAGEAPTPESATQRLTGEIAEMGVIFCPRNRQGGTRRRLRKILHLLQERGAAFDYVWSESPGSVERLASMMTRAGYKKIVVVGGDAALNHALCGIFSVGRGEGRLPVLGVIPAGYGNDFARFWELNAGDSRTAVDAVLRGHERKVDVGVCTLGGKGGHKYYFLNCVNLGVAASITSLRRKTRTLCGLNTLSYLFSAVLLLFKRHAFRFTFHLPGERVDDRRAMTLCIGSSRGYGQTPSAVPYNGLLDVTMVSAPQPTQVLHGVWLLFTNRFLSHKDVSVWRTKSIAFESTGNAPISIDGRVVHERVSQVDLSVMQEKISFIIP